MQLSREQIKQNAVAFSERWKDASDEKSDGQNFVRDFLAVFGVSDAATVGRFEERALRDSGRGFMDYLWPKMIAVEMKSKGKDLEDAYKQLKDYVLHLSTEVIPDLMMVSDFENIVLYRRTTNQKWEFKTENLCERIDLFHDVAGFEKRYELDEQFEVNLRAAEKMANLHDNLERFGYEGHVLEVYLVRLLFCLFAEDTGIFPQDSFLSYVQNSREDGSDLSGRIVRLFDILNMPDEIRAKRTQLPPDLREFRYINGRLFGHPLPPADFDAKMRLTLIDCCRFDWSKISPAIFGAMFQGVTNKGKRRELGVHYTSEENIMRVIDTLFMDDLRAKLERVKSDKRRLDDFHDEIAGLKFLDPACGCGNFLMIAYRELRKLEIEILRIKKTAQKVLDVSQFLRVNVEQFYGIEIEDFPCEIAGTGLWLMDHLMNREATKELGAYYVRLPLTQSATIIHGNALRIDWESVVPKNELSYIISNPPYVGYSFQTKSQKEDVLSIYLDARGNPLKTAGKIDYVAAWYYKAAKMMAGTRIHTAFVSTNSITQGEQVAAIWKPLFEMFGVHIDFAYRTFKWTNEAKGKAAVHCVIIGFSASQGRKKVIYDGKEKIAVNNINPYLVDAPDILVEGRNNALGDVPAMVYGNKPTDGGHLFIKAEEIEGFLIKEPKSEKYIKKVYGSEEYINNLDRYCLWLVGAEPSELKKMPLVMERIDNVRKFRLASKKGATRDSAATPTLFQEVRQPTSNYIIIPRVSSERRNVIPIGFLPPDIIVNDSVQIIPDATLYHFGILTSSVHMAWTRAVCGRLKSDYRYSKDIVYNNFPWPTATEEQKGTIEMLAQAVLDARAKFLDSSLADLYDPLTMPPELLKAHQTLDRAVMKLYGFGKDLSEHAIVAKLMERYQKLTTPLIPEPTRRAGKRNTSRVRK
ncbi:MAG: hypothetical protein FWC43_02275 [Planctomycetaceae bacterium]|nr:hypothetical protein [Planctomycetaceae bacterium]